MPTTRSGDETRSSLEAGARVDGKYRLLRPIGAGAIGQVWCALNERIDREVAIKFLVPDWAIEPSALSFFFQDSKASGKIRHPSIVQILDLGETEQDVPYVVMELLEAEKLETFLERQPGIREGTVMRIVAELSSALAMAHDAQLIHHRIEPANILLHRDLRGVIVPKLTDFGVARLIEEQAPESLRTWAQGNNSISPLEYLCPEQAAGESAEDGRSDVWSLGVLMYRMLMGKEPFIAKTRGELLDAMQAPRKRLHELDPGIDSQVSHLASDCLAMEVVLRPTARVLSERAGRLAKRLGDDWESFGRKVFITRLAETPTAKPVKRVSVADARTDFPALKAPVARVALVKLAVPRAEPASPSVSKPLPEAQARAPFAPAPSAFPPPKPRSNTANAADVAAAAAAALAVLDLEDEAETPLSSASLEEAPISSSDLEDAPPSRPLVVKSLPPPRHTTLRAPGGAPAPASPARAGFPPAPKLESLKPLPSGASTHDIAPISALIAERMAQSHSADDNLDSLTLADLEHELMRRVRDSRASETNRGDAAHAQPAGPLPVPVLSAKEEAQRRLEETTRPDRPAPIARASAAAPDTLRTHRVGSVATTLRPRALPKRRVNPVLVALPIALVALVGGWALARNPKPSSSATGDPSAPRVTQSAATTPTELPSATGNTDAAVAASTESPTPSAEVPSDTVALATATAATTNTPPPAVPTVAPIATALPTPIATPTSTPTPTPTATPTPKPTATIPPIATATKPKPKPTNDPTYGVDNAGF